MEVRLPDKAFWRDAWLPAVLFVVGAIELAALQPTRWGVGIALEGLASVLLVFRRRHPFLLPTLATLTLLIMPWIGPGLQDPSTPIAYWALSIFTLGRHLADLRGVIGVALILAMAAVQVYTEPGSDATWAEMVFITVLVAPPYILGRLVRKLAEQGQQLREQQELVRGQAVRAERDRIARELHDVIAHSVSAMVIQAAAARDMVRADPAQTERLLDQVAGTGRRALAETGKLLHVIRADEDEMGLSPLPGLANLGTLVGGFRASGLDVDLQVEGDVDDLPAGVDVSAYRVVQEALTNAQRHGDSAAVLHLVRSDGALRIQVANQLGHGSVQGGGLGLLGMAERVSLLGGTMRRDERDGRFVVDISLPVESP
jgi:signal transduction histidine kinase